jgi:hypothetical protein
MTNVMTYWDTKTLTITTHTMPPSPTQPPSSLFPQVYEEKQKRCELELEELRQSCATRMQTQSQKAQRAQQVLQLQVFQLQQEKKLLQEDFGQLLQEREKLEERCTSYEKIQLGSRLDETKWEVRWTVTVCGPISNPPIL